MPRPRHSIVVAVQAAFLIIVVWLAWRTIAASSGEIDWSSSSIRVSVGWILGASALVLATYLMLIEVWVRHLRLWGARLHFGSAARMWFVVNLGKYIPGKIWGLATMAVMAQQRGISQFAALGSTVTGMVIGMIAGFAVVVATGSGVIDAIVRQTGGKGTGTGATVAVLALALLGLASAPVVVPAVVRMGARVARQDLPVPRLSAGAIWGLALATGLSWVVYGVAFAMFTRGILETPAGGVAAYIAVYTASYLLGLATLIPGGIVVREGSLVVGLTALRLVSAPDAVILAVTSRIWLTVLEILPGVVVLAVGARSTGGER